MCLKKKKKKFSENLKYFTFLLSFWVIGLAGGIWGQPALLYKNKHKKKKKNPKKKKEKGNLKKKIFFAVYFHYNGSLGPPKPKMIIKL